MRELMHGRLVVLIDVGHAASQDYRGKSVDVSLSFQLVEAKED